MPSAPLNPPFLSVRRLTRALMLPLLAMVFGCSQSVPSKFSVENEGNVESFTMAEMIENSSESSQHFALGEESKVYFRITHVKFRRKYELSYNWTGLEDAYYQKLLVADDDPPASVSSALKAGIREVLEESLERSQQRDAPLAE